MFYWYHWQHRNSRAFRENGYGAGCQEVVYLLSDGGTVFPEEVLQNLNWNLTLLGSSWIQPKYLLLYYIHIRTERIHIKNLEFFSEQQIPSKAQTL